MITNKMDFNRVESEVRNWQDTEARIGKLFSFAPSANRAMLGEKLRFYDLISAKYRRNISSEERYTLAYVLQERRKIERQLYPNLLVRLIRRLLIAPVLKRKATDREIKKRELNSHALQEDLQLMGFSDVFKKAESKIRQGHDSFTIPISYFVDDHIRMDHQVSFSRNGNGEYNVNGFEAALHNQRKPSEVKRQFFGREGSDSIDADQACKLLRGRALEKDGKWIQLDFNDRDEKGNFRIRDYRTGTQYDLREKLKEFPSKPLSPEEEKKIVENLKAGERTSVSFSVDGVEKRFYIEANPQFRNITIYDEHSKKITLGNKERMPNDITVVHRAQELLEKPGNKSIGRKIK